MAMAAIPPMGAKVVLAAPPPRMAGVHMPPAVMLPAKRSAREPVKPPQMTLTIIMLEMTKKRKEMGKQPGWQ